MSEEQVAQAVVGAINANLVAPRAAFDLDDVPAPRPVEYVEVTVSRRFGGESRMGGGGDTTGYRIGTRAVAHTVSNARLLRVACRLALEDVALTVGSQVTTNVEFEFEQDIGPDDGRYSGLTDWTCRL